MAQGRPLLSLTKLPCHPQSCPGWASASGGQRGNWTQSWTNSTPLCTQSQFLQLPLRSAQDRLWVQEPEAAPGGTPCGPPPGPQEKPTRRWESLDSTAEVGTLPWT
ncbi:uncharacterized protein LOC129536644 isoform X10 [Moschus berezovskii]|uniref:uncharacterized protein LOC129536644 isoform X10 n=1 Tax=Moschus berezovskii TaxID=68408 RepID=UPI0024438962|nr:uncharacterized protein LOC129536644 isoform X10 [Moschus berezovskii]